MTSTANPAHRPSIWHITKMEYRLRQAEKATHPLIKANHLAQAARHNELATNQAARGL